jgi:hypothetical protein
MSKVLKIKYYNPFDGESINKRIEFQNNFQDLLKWCKEFKQIPYNKEYEFIEENSNKKINNDFDYQNLKNTNEKVIKLKLNIVEKQENNKFNLLSENINIDSNQPEKTENINKIFQENSSNNQNNNNENQNNFQQNNINNKNNNIYNNININNINENKYENNNTNFININNNNTNTDNEIETLNSKIKESITILVKEKMQKFEEEIINELFNNVSLNSSKLLEQSKLFLSLPSMNKNNENLVIHNIKCSNCNEIIKGELFKCSKCKEFYLCSNCEELTEHDENHIFIKIRDAKDDKINLNNIPEYDI